MSSSSRHTQRDEEGARWSMSKVTAPCPGVGPDRLNAGGFAVCPERSGERGCLVPHKKCELPAHRVCEHGVEEGDACEACALHAKSVNARCLTRLNDEVKNRQIRLEQDEDLSGCIEIVDEKVSSR